MIYSKEFLISEIHRFVEKNGRNPKSKHMKNEFGYPSCGSFQNYFGSWNNALLVAGLKINRKHHIGILNGNETCDNCGNLKSEGKGWHYENNQRICDNCYFDVKYIDGNLDPESTVGFAFISQRVVAKTLGLELKYDCNCSQGFKSAYDLYDKSNYKNINVKTATLNFKKESWFFNLKNKEIPDTYIMLGFSSDKGDILHVWITNSTDNLIFGKKSIHIRNAEYSLKRAASCEVAAEPYNDAYHSMSLDNCSVLKNK